MRELLQKFYRFIEIDVQYFRTSLSLKRKFSDVFRTNILLFFNLIFKPTNFSPVIFGDRKVSYDTPFATKTLLTTVYDFYKETKLATLFSKNPTIIDIGANIGQFVIASKSFYPKAKMYSVEPDREVFKILESNASQYKDVEIFNYGLSDKSGEVAFYRSKDFSEWSGLAPLADHKYEKITVKVKRGDDIFRGINNIDMIKIDVEGAELEVLRGFKKTIARSRYILIEASIQRNKRDIGSTDVLTFLFDNNFVIDHIGRIFADSRGMSQGAVDILFKNTKVTKK